MKLYGETGLDIYKRHPFVDDSIEKMKKFDEMASMERFVYLTKRGIMSKWNFSGAVASKQQSMAPNDDMDMLRRVESVNVVGVNIAGESRIHNLWGDVKPGHQLYLVLSRKRLNDGKYGQFQWFSWFGKRGDRPNFTYVDERKQKQDAFVVYIGLCTRASDGAPTKKQIAGALGHYNNLEEAYETYGTLPCIMVQIEI